VDLVSLARNGIVELARPGESELPGRTLVSASYVLPAVSSVLDWRAKTESAKDAASDACLWHVSERGRRPAKVCSRQD
jgi:hypothetical protein